MKHTFDVIVIGAGSIDLPCALSLAQAGFSVCVLDARATAGQGQNKSAIGGIRATHTEPAKIYLCQESIAFFSQYETAYGDPIGWKQGGYTYPVYEEAHERLLRDQVAQQQRIGLHIRWLPADQLAEVIPGINTKGLRGGTYSPEDGSANPLQVATSLHKQALRLGVRFHFNERVCSFTRVAGRITEVQTDKATYCGNWIINATGARAAEVGALLDIPLPVAPDNHEAGITEPVMPFFAPMVVDMRKTDTSSNFYFYQSSEGQVVFCITPDPPILGMDSDHTSSFLPMVAQRMIALFPRLQYLRVRRTWRGQYPNTPDGFPIVDLGETCDNLLNLVGMCGQGFMLGPGIAGVVTRFLRRNPTEKDTVITDRLRLSRDYSGKETFK